MRLGRRIRLRRRLDERDPERVLSLLGRVVAGQDPDVLVRRAGEEPLREVVLFARGLHEGLHSAGAGERHDGRDARALQLRDDRRHRALNRIGVERDRRRSRHLAPEVAEVIGEEAVVDRPIRHHPELTGLVGDVLTCELRLLVDELLADHLGRIDRRCVVVSRTPQVRRQFGRVRVRRRITRGQDLRRRQSRLQDLHVETADLVHTANGFIALIATRSARCAASSEPVEV